MADCCSMEILGWIVTIFIGAKSVYNICHFVYTTWLGHLLGHSIDLRKCGPWAGTITLEIKWRGSKNG